MPATFKGLAPNIIYPQPGFEPTMNSNGAWEGDHVFHLTRASLSNSAVRLRFRKGVSVASLDPNVPSFFAFMTLDSMRVRFAEGDIVHIIAKFAGAEGAQYGGDDGGLGGSAEPTYDLDGTLSEKPISEHPKWKELTVIQKTALGHLLDGTLVFDEEKGKICKINPSAATADKFFDPFLPYDEIVIGDCLEFAKRIAAGKITYEVASITWTERTEGNVGLSNSQLNKLSNIATPRGNPPEGSGERNWRLTNAHQSVVGGKYRTELEWTLSDEGGFDEFIYDDS